MAYRCFLLDDASHFLGPAEIINAPDDGTATAQAMNLCKGRKSCAVIELWCGDRLVARLKASEDG